MNPFKKRILKINPFFKEFALIKFVNFIHVKGCIAEIPCKKVQPITILKTDSTLNIPVSVARVFKIVEK